MEGDGIVPAYWLPMGNALYFTPKKSSLLQFPHYSTAPATVLKCPPEVQNLHFPKYYPVQAFCRGWLIDRLYFLSVRWTFKTIQTGSLDNFLSTIKTICFCLNSSRLSYIKKVKLQALSMKCLSSISRKKYRTRLKTFQAYFSNFAAAVLLKSTIPKKIAHAPGMKCLVLPFIHVTKHKIILLNKQIMA